MSDERLRTPEKEEPLLVAETGGWFEAYRPPPLLKIGEIERNKVKGAKCSLVYDGQPDAILTADFKGFRIRIDVHRGKVIEGEIEPEAQREALSYAERARDELVSAWGDMHTRHVEMQRELAPLVAELTDPNDEDDSPL